MRRAAFEPDRRRVLASLAMAAALPWSASPRIAKAAPGSAGLQAYFLDAEGDDASDGRSPSRAWRSADALAQIPPEASCEIRLRRGQVWRGGLRIVCRAARLRPYGVGPRPVIEGGEPLGRLERAAPVPGGAAWRCRRLSEPLQVLAGGRHLMRMASPREVDRPGRWHWSGRRLLAATAGEAPPDLLAIAHARGVDVRACEVASLSGITVRHAVVGIDADDAWACEVASCRVEGAYLNGLRASAAHPRGRLVVRGATIEETAGTAIAFGGQIDAVVIEANTIRRAGLLTDATAAAGSSGGERSLAWTAGIKNWGWGEGGWQGEVAIRGNRIEGCGPAAQPGRPPRPEHGHGIWIDEVVEPRARHSVAFNQVTGCASRGIYIEKSDRIDVDYNAVHDCARTPGTGALALQANIYGYDVRADAPALVPRSCRRNRLRHNSVLGGHWALEAIAEAPDCWLGDNTVEDNVLVGLKEGRVRGGAIHCVGGGANDGRSGAGNRYARNCVGPAEGRVLRWGRWRSGHPGQAEAVSRGAFSASIPADPRLVDAAAGDLRLQAASPCRDRAISIPHDRDIQGNPVPLGGAADVGCHEFAAWNRGIPE